MYQQKSARDGARYKIFFVVYVTECFLTDLGEIRQGLREKCCE